MYYINVKITIDYGYQRECTCSLEMYAEVLRVERERKNPKCGQNVNH